MTELDVIREIAPSARIGPDVKIGPYCVVGPNVTIGPTTELVRRVSVGGRTVIGSGNRFEEGCVIGAAPQDLKYKGGQTLLLIGQRNRFCRNVTVHLGTELGGGLSRIGDDNVLLEGCHIGHDCYVDDRAHIGRNVLLGGHIRIQSGAVVDDAAALHPFVTVGRYARVGARTPVRRDVPPYAYFSSRGPDDNPSVHGANEEGVRSAELDAGEEKDLRSALRELFDDEAALETKIEQLVNSGVEGEAADLCDFCQKSLQGLYGRYRELFRGKMPPEAQQYLPPEMRQAMPRVM